MNIYYEYYKSPVGKLLLVGDGVNIMKLGFPSGKMKLRHERNWTRDGLPFKQAILVLFIN